MSIKVSLKFLAGYQKLFSWPGNLLQHRFASSHVDYKYKLQGDVECDRSVPSAGQIMDSLDVTLFNVKQTIHPLSKKIKDKSLRLKKLRLELTEP